MNRTRLASWCAAMVVLSLGTAAVAAGEANQWSKVADGQKQRQGAVLVWAADLNKALLVGDGVQAFDPAKAAWADLSAAKADPKRGIEPFYQSAYDAKTQTVYCLSNSPVLYAFDAASKSWKANPPDPALDGLSWDTLAGDGAGRLVVVGSDKRIDNVGWTRTAVYDAAAGKWSTLPLPPADVAKTHRDLVEATERTIDLVGHIRLAWYRDPKGVGTEEELKALAVRCDELGKLAGMAAFKAEITKVADLLKARTTLDALKAARAMQRNIEDVAFEQYPVPCSRRNAPLVYDAADKLFVLFGGDHEDYQMNDTWTLDLAKNAWKRMKPAVAPSPRAGHAACYLPKSGRVAIYEGYLPNNDGDYGVSPWQTISPRELWAYDARGDRWDLAGAWPTRAAKDAAALAAPPVIGKFYGYSASFFEVPAMAADAADTIFVAAPGAKDQPGTTWALPFDSAKLDAAGREKLGCPPNQRHVRDIYFRADYCEIPNDPGAKDLATLPANRWTPFAPVARKAGERPPAHGCRQRDWGTAVWDSDRDQVVMWGGGHCVRSSSTPLHFSPVSNRIVEGYDADEPYQYNGLCGPGSSLLNKQWIECHGYNLYAYDPKCKLLVTARGFLYDPERMDWLRAEPIKPPFYYEWGHVVVETSPYGAVAWAGQAGNHDQGNLWLFDRDKGWGDLAPKAAAAAKLFAPWCDADGMVYDAKRDRMLIGCGASARKGPFMLSFDFKTKAVEKISPENAGLAPSNTREMVYVPGADIVLFGSVSYPGGGGEEGAGRRGGTQYTRVYDCQKNRYALLDAGPAVYGHSCGWMFDAKRGMAYIFGYNGAAWAMRVVPESLKLLDQPAGQ